MTKTEWMDKYQDGLLDAYYKLCAISAKDEDMMQPRMELEAALVNLGLLEADEEPDEEPEDEEEDLNTSTNWDEWAADQRFDMYRDLALMGYEY